MKALEPKTLEPAARGLHLRSVDPMLCNGDWASLVTDHGESTPFHSGAWARVLHKTYGHRPFYILGEQDGDVSALVPIMEVRSAITGRRGVCLPFSDFASPLLWPGCDRNSLQAQLEQFAVSRGWKHLEIRGLAPIGSGSPSGGPFLQHTLDLSAGTESLRANLTASTRRCVRSAERAGLRIEERYDLNAMVSFYELHEKTRRGHGLPPQPLSFFSHVQEEMMAAGLGCVVLAWRGSTLVAGAVFLHSGNQAVYKYGASDSGLQHLRGNHLVMWTAICLYAERGYKLLNFGRTSKNQAGLRRYKLGWGGQETDLPCFQWQRQTNRWVPQTDNATGAHNFIFANLPLRVNRVLGSFLYQHLD